VHTTIDSDLVHAGHGDPVSLARCLVAIPSVNPTLEAGGAGERLIAERCAAWLEGWGFATRMEEVAPGRCNVVATRDGAGPAPPLVVALTADEEHASLGMQALVGSGVKADLAVVCEPTGLSVMPAHKGFVWVRASFRGRAAHGSRPDLGIDAIRHAALFLTALDSLSDELEARPPHPLLGCGSLHAGTIRGGTAESVYPERCELLLERRTLPGEGPAAIMAELSTVLEGLKAHEHGLDATLEVTLERPGTEVPADSTLVGGLLEAGASHDVPRVVEGMTAWVDAAFLNEAGIPAVCYGPGYIAQAHSADEWIELDQIGRCADVLETFARSLCS
jgi:acetylornithine deacetylase